MLAKCVRMILDPMTDGIAILAQGELDYLEPKVKTPIVKHMHMIQPNRYYILTYDLNHAANSSSQNRSNSCVDNSEYKF